MLILGGGLAGLRAALSCDAKAEVLVVTKDRLRQSNSSYAQGGIASVIDPNDRLEWHVRDTLVAGANLCRPEVVDMVVEQGPKCIADLIQLGTQFDEVDNKLTLGREGGHSHNRIIHAMGDATGAEIMRAVIQTTKNAANIQVAENAFTIDLLVIDGACHGAVVLMENQIQILWAQQTIIATGGAGQLFRETTNPSVATADGHAMAIRAGVAVRDMEFMQFHPTVLYVAGGTRSLITEAVRGEGAYLLDRMGHRFMPDYDQRAELAPRDVVAQAIVDQMEATQHPNVYLSMQHLDAAETKKRFPGIFQTCSQFGIDITRDLIPVRPGAHYMIGGAIVDIDGRTSMPNLWAAGEVTSSGLHGANRLASNSLLEGIVFGDRAGRLASQEALGSPRQFDPASLNWNSPPRSHDDLDLTDIRNSLRSLMMRNVGVKRNADDLAETASALDTWAHLILNRTFHLPAAWELQNLLTAAFTMVDAARTREESRGVHFRTDFPVDQPQWRRSIIYVKNRRTLSELLPEQPPVPST
ncbi:MAG: L-aspartate oxidase [Pirellulaceae bacterium]